MTQKLNPLLYFYQKKIPHAVRIACDYKCFGRQISSGIQTLSVSSLLWQWKQSDFFCACASHISNTHQKKYIFLFYFVYVIILLAFVLLEYHYLMLLYQVLLYYTHGSDDVTLNGQIYLLQKHIHSRRVFRETSEPVNIQLCDSSHGRCSAQ